MENLIEKYYKQEIKKIIDKSSEILEEEQYKRVIEYLIGYLSSQLEPPVIPKIADTDWMPVEDLPDDNSGYYLCYTKYIYNDDKPQYFYETARIEDRQWYAPNGENITDNVIYWKELPKAPH